MSQGGCSKGARPRGGSFGMSRKSYCVGCALVWPWCLGTWIWISCEKIVFKIVSHWFKACSVFGKMWVDLLCTRKGSENQHQTYDLGCVCHLFQRLEGEWWCWCLCLPQNNRLPTTLTRPLQAVGGGKFTTTAVVSSCYHTHLTSTWNTIINLIKYYTFNVHLWSHNESFRLQY